MENITTPQRREIDLRPAAVANGVTSSGSINKQQQSRQQYQQQNRQQHHQHMLSASDSGGFHLQTEEGVDGAQADFDDVDDMGQHTDGGEDAYAQSISSPQNIESSPSPSAAMKTTTTNQTSAFAQQKQLQQQQYSLENSSFGVGGHIGGQQRMGLMVPEQESSELALLHQHQSKNQGSPSLVQDNDISESGVEEPRRGRAMRHQSYKNLFSKNSTTNSQLQLLGVEGQHSQVMEEGNPNSHKIQFRPEQQLRQQSMTEDDDEDETYPNDQDGGQDSSNFVDFVDGESSCLGLNAQTSSASAATADDQQRLLILQQSSQQMQAAMMNFRRTRPNNQNSQHQQPSQPLSSYGGTWTVQEPHIDEELSDAEEDNSSDNPQPMLNYHHQQQNHCHNHDDQRQHHRHHRQQKSGNHDPCHLNVDDQQQQTEAVDESQEDDQNSEVVHEDIDISQEASSAAIHTSGDEGEQGEDDYSQEDLIMVDGVGPPSAGPPGGPLSSNRQQQKQRPAAISKKKKKNNKPHYSTGLMKATSASKRVLRTENNCVTNNDEQYDELDLFQQEEERTPEQTPQRSSKHHHNMILPMTSQFSSTQQITAAKSGAGALQSTSEAKTTATKITKHTAGGGSKKYGGNHTPAMEVAAKSQSTTGYQMPSSKSTNHNHALQTTVQKKKSSQASRQQRMKAQGIASMKVQKISSIDFTQSALQPKRSTLYNNNQTATGAASNTTTAIDENSNQDLSATLKTLKNNRGDPMETYGGSRATPRSQPITNFQLQQEQAKLIRHRQINQSQKMNHTAFGSSLISSSKGAGNTANASQQNASTAGQPMNPPTNTNNSQSYSTFLNEKQATTSTSVVSQKHQQNSQLLYKHSQQVQQSKGMISKGGATASSGNSTCNLQKPLSNPSKTANAMKGSQSNQSRQHVLGVADNLLKSGVGSSSSKKQGVGKATGQKEPKNNAKESNSIFITAKQSSSSAANCKQILAKNSIGSGIKPFSTEIESSEIDNKKESGSKTASTFSSASPEKRFSSRQNAQAAAISVNHPSLVHVSSSAGLSKTVQQKKEKSRSSAQVLPGTLSGGGSASNNSILQNHLRQLHNHQQSFTNLQSVSSQFKDNMASRHQDLKQISTWNSQSTPVYPPPPASSTSANQSKPMSFSKPTAASSMSHSGPSVHLKTSTSVKESSILASTKDGGFLSHTAARATGKKGFFGRDNNETASNTGSLKASIAQLHTASENKQHEPSKSGTTTGNQRSSSKGKKKNSIKQPNALKAKRSSITTKTGAGADHGAYMSTEASQAKIITAGGSFKPQESSQSLLCDANAACLVRPPSSSKNTDHQHIFHPNSNSSSNVGTATKRQRTNTQLGLQSHKHSSLRQSTNNLTLQDLMAQQTTNGGVLSKPLGTVTKQSSNRGGGPKDSEKTTSSAAASFAAAGSVVSNFKSNSLVKQQSSVSGVSKKSNNLLGTGQSRSSGIQQISERVELMSAKVTSTGISSFKKTSGASATTTSAISKNINGGNGKKGDDQMTGTGKLRSQSTLKNQMSAAAGAPAHSSGNPNSSLLNFTTQPYEQQSKMKQRQSNNAQHSIIMAAVEGGKSAAHAQIQNSSRGITAATASGVRSATDSKRTSIQAGNTGGAGGASSKEWGLADFEKAQYGDRCPKGYEKISLLGKGGCAVVWLAREIQTGRNVALKQFPKPKNSQGMSGTLDPTARIEIEMGRLLFSENSLHNGYSINPAEFPGILKMAKLYSVIEEAKDVWLAYQVGGKCLTNHLFDVKGEFYKGERIYGVQHQDFYRALKEDKQVIVDLIRMLAEVLDVLAMFRIVHADIKPDNILIDFDGRRLRDIKLIDFGSAFSYENPSQISATTPEYLAPEVLDYLERRGQNTDSNGANSTNLCRRQEPWSYDMWSTGAILLEMLTGIPLWMSLKCRAQTQTGKQLFGMGIFGVQGRQGKKILQKQNTSLKNLQQTLKKYDCYGLDKDPMFMDLLLKMLDPNPITRISPIEVLEHPYIKDKHGTALESPN